MNAVTPAPLHAALHADGRAAAAAPLRSALALGLVGSLGEELLAALVSSNEYSIVNVAVSQPIGSASSRFRPWVVGQGVLVVDDAFIGVTGDETFVPKTSPIRRCGEGELLEAARTARDAGARTLVLIAPLPALLQMGEATRTLASVDDIALVNLGFERLVMIRPSAADDPRRLGHPILNVMRSVGRTLADLMLPSYTRPLSARAAAQAILTAVRAAPRGVTVLGAKELTAIVQARFPALAPKKRLLR